ALLKLLNLKFGDVSQDLRHQIETAETDTLLEWLGRVLTAQSIDEVLH
ncbi:MAG TPA: cytosolic protein, partial [Gammaproteobacteria bacterium]|nr:cytosolic protein [Gammaproteobacteria bacterium]